MRRKAESGLWPSSAPLGYCNVMASSGRRVIEPHPEKAPVVRAIFERAATGMASLRELVDLASSLGITDKHGNRLAKSQVQTVLTNPIYYGEFDWAGKRYTGFARAARDPRAVGPRPERH
jgi:hypothetical protein